jgi:hypothetical protein
MSFATLKSNMLRYMQNQGGINSFDDFASKLTQEYDFCIKRGFQTINNIPIQTGNVNLMETLVKVACRLSLSKKSGQHTFIDDIGKGVVGYWTGAQLITGPPPVIPATGAISNISSNSNPVLSPGQWTPIGPTPPVNDSNIFLDLLISGMRIHITTPTGIYLTTSIYPSAPSPIVAPGVVNWTGYSVP